ncbi:MAG: KpsF/GutQ family sugar-phosphate isomerase [Planctomycetes bacterium]|nr:KpsF/GutQ family sugar-phosphate isomerase [Planctomycetota bacterium]
MTDIREFGKSVIEQEAAGLQQLAGILDESFDQAVSLIQHCTGHVVIAGVGKPWLIGQKISATMASVGTPSFALHPSEAMHGDLGRLRESDVVIAMSNSGASEEITRVVPVIKRIGCQLIAITANLESPLAKASDVVINIGKVSEACPIGMAPSVSTTVLLALGDALSLAAMKAKNFTREDYAKFHPGGALGRSLMKVAEIMRPLSETANVEASATVGDALHEITLHKTGAAFVLEAGKIIGVFTDGDLRRHVEDENLLSQTVRDVMTTPCRTVDGAELSSVAVKLIQEFRIGELPVTDETGKLLGHVALKDLVSGQFV